MMDEALDVDVSNHGLVGIATVDSAGKREDLTRMMGMMRNGRTEAAGKKKMKKKNG